MTCTSTLQRVKPATWECTGHDLTIVDWTTIDGVRYPLVCPNDRVAGLDPDKFPGPFEPYTDTGDHLHLHLPGSGT